MRFGFFGTHASERSVEQQASRGARRKGGHQISRFSRPLAAWPARGLRGHAGRAACAAWGFGQPGGPIAAAALRALMLCPQRCADCPQQTPTGRARRDAWAGRNSDVFSRQGGRAELRGNREHGLFADSWRGRRPGAVSAGEFRASRPGDVDLVLSRPSELDGGAAAPPRVRLTADDQRRLAGNVWFASHRACTSRRAGGQARGGDARLERR